MHISRVLVRNFRNFLELEIDPIPRSAVIVGENGIGKSNLLHALRLVLDPDLPDSARKLRAEDICEYAATTIEDGVEVRIEVDVTDFEGDLAAEATLDGCYVSLDPLVARVAYVFRPREAVDGSSRKLSRDDYDWEIVGGPDGEADARRIRRDVSVSVLPALRDAVSELSKWRGSPLQELLEARPPNADALDAAAKSITDAMDVLAGDDQITAIAGELSQRLTDMAGPQMDITPTLGFASSVPSRLLRSIRLFVDASRTRSVAETSTGNANVIYLGLLLERLVARMAADDVVDSVLAVEEPEAHLHPVLQRQLFRYLLGSGTALVVTTHSPHIAAVAPLPSLVLLRSGAEGGTVAATTARAQLSDGQRADLERYLDVSRAELLFCTAAILVEGPSEVYLVPALARALDFDLDAHGVIVANVAGTDFAPYRILLGAMALDVPQVIITDGDPVRDGKHVYAGIARAVNLCPAGPAKDALANQLSALIEAGAGADVASARVGAMAADVFVGVQTLEIDIAALLADQMTKAHAEIETSQNLIGSFDQAVRSVAQSGSNDDQRREVLRRVEYVSKGRFAQRLAAHVDGIDPAGLTVVIQGQLLVKPEPSSSCAETMAGLMGAGSYGYLLAAMDRVSWQVRGHGLLPAPAAPTVSADA